MRLVPVPLVVALAVLPTACMDYELIPDKIEEPPPPDGDDDAGNGGEDGDNDCNNECDTWMQVLPPLCTAVACGPSNQVSALGPDEHSAYLPNTGAACELIVDCEHSGCTNQFESCLDANTLDFCRDLYLECQHVVDCRVDQHTCYEEVEDWYENECDHDNCDWFRCQREFWCDCDYENCIDGTNLECAGGFEGGGFEECDEAFPPAAPFAAPVGAGHWTIQRTQLVDRAANLTRLRRLNPVWPERGPGGQLAGLRLGTLASEGVAWASGLRDGDLVTHVNGVSVIELMLNPVNILPIAQAPTVVVTLRRAGTVEHFRYDLLD